METQEKKKVLIVDDDENLRVMMGDKLVASGFDAFSARDGDEGLAKALAAHPDVILLDILMPKVNGWEMLERLRNDTWGKQAHVIMLTSLDGVDNVAHALKRGSYDYFVKTNANLDDIVKRVKEKLEL